MPSVVAYCDVYTAAFAGRRMATVLPRNRGLKTCGYLNKKTYSVPLRYASAATLTQYPHSSVPNRHASYPRPPHHRHSIVAGRLISDAYLFPGAKLQLRHNKPVTL